MMESKIKVDLHMHTTTSDGSIEIRDLLNEILDKKIGLFSVTEHDSIDNIDFISSFSKKHKINYIPGVELSATFKGRRMHILGYGINHMNQSIIDFTKSNTILFRQEEDEGKNVEYPEPEVTIEMIQSAGGTPILAHAGAPFYDPNYEDLINQMLDRGIAGLECYHPQNNDEVTRYCMDLCQSKNLIMTGGSDYHGDCVPSRQLDMMMLSMEDINLKDLSRFVNV